ncbi:unnamed protein product, partial [Mesorhabditis spiculigera]
MNGTEEPALEHPEPLPADYIEMAYLLFLIIAGTPSNFFILRRLMAELKRTPKDSVKAGFLLLKINLNISDLLLLLVALFKLIWIWIYNWPWGDLLCKGYAFSSLFSLYISSNIVVCIALDRLRNVLGASKLRKGKGVNGSVVHWLLSGAWVLSIIWAIPQMFFWTTVEAYTDWYQCTTIWTIKQAMIDSKQATEADYGVLYGNEAQVIYNIYHLVLVFWGPLFVLITCYFIIALRLVKYSRNRPCHTNGIIRPEPTSNGLSGGMEQSLSLHQFETASTTVSVEPHCLARISTIRRSFDRFSDRGPSPNLRPNSRLGSSLPFARYFQRNGRSMDNIYARDDTTPPLKKVSKVSESSGTKAPAWRRQLRSKVFRTTLLVVIAHFVFWLPYNTLALMKYVSDDMYQALNENANIFKDMQLLIVLINPFLYGFAQ